MSFFKDFKEDLSQAVNELLPGEEMAKTGSGQPDLVINTQPGSASGNGCKYAGTGSGCGV